MSESHCVICGMPRLEAESTGVLCGRLRCAKELGDRLEEFHFQMESFDVLRRMIEIFHISDEEFPYDLKEIVDKELEWFNLLEKYLKQICEELKVGLDENDFDELSPPEICERILNKISQQKNRGARL